VRTGVLTTLATRAYRERLARTRCASSCVTSSRAAKRAWALPRCGRGSAQAARAGARSDRSRRTPGSRGSGHPWPAGDRFRRARCGGAWRAAAGGWRTGRPRQIVAVPHGASQAGVAEHLWRRFAGRVGGAETERIRESQGLAMNIIDLQRRQPGPRAEQLLDRLQAAAN
jgi:hypothetical protein